MVAISVRADFDKAVAALEVMAAKQIPYAAARALTATARQARDTIAGELSDIFDRPTPFTQRGIAALVANKGNLQVTVLVKDRQSACLVLQEAGGPRASETGRALGLPGKGKKLSRDGNIPRNRLARLRADAAIAGGKGSPDRSTTYLAAGVPGNARPGGYSERLGGHRQRRLTAFLSATSYKPRFGFLAGVEAVALATYPERLAARLTDALRTAR